jgi:hypothetical protein
MEDLEKEIQELETLQEEFGSENKNIKATEEDGQSKNIVITPVQQEINKRT